MAYWQFQIEFIPRAWHARARGDLSSLFDEAGCDTAPAWRENQPANTLDELFSPVFPEPPVRIDDCLRWGTSGGTDAHVCRERGMVASVGMHLDMHRCGAGLLNQIAEIAAGLNCVLLVPEAAAVIEPNVFALSQALRASHVARYAQDSHHTREDGREDEPGDGPDDGPEQA